MSIWWSRLCFEITLRVYIYSHMKLWHYRISLPSFVLIVYSFLCLVYCYISFILPLFVYWLGIYSIALTFVECSWNRIVHPYTSLVYNVRLFDLNMIVVPYYSHWLVYDLWNPIYSFLFIYILCISSLSLEFSWQ